jgi:hypothetical protein
MIHVDVFHLPGDEFLRPSISTCRDGEPPSLDEAEIFLQSSEAGIRLFLVGFFQVDVEPLLPESEDDPESFAPLFEPGHNPPPTIARVGTSDITPTQGQRCPQIAPKPGIREEKRLFGTSPKSLVIKGFCSDST